jgi:hypothetical protein
MASADRKPLIAYLGVQTKMDRELRATLLLASKEASKRIAKLENKTGIGAAVRADQLAGVIAAIRKDQRSLWGTDIMRILLKFLPLAERAADNYGKVLDRVFRTAVGERAANEYLKSLDAASRAGIELLSTRRTVELSQRVYRNADLSAGRVERMVKAGIIQGLSAKELAKSVEKFVSPNTPGGVAYAAMRLARTELNNAFHAEQVAVAESKPWVKGPKWNLSKSHPHDDDCDKLAKGHSKGCAPGVYRSDEVPDKPHPHCLCFLTYDVISEDAMVRLMREKLGKAA